VTGRVGGGRLPWVLGAAAWGMIGAALLIPAGAPGGMAVVVLPGIWAATNAAVGSVVAARRPENPIGWLLSASGLLVAVALLAGQYAIYTLVARPGVLPGGRAVLWLSGWPFDAGLLLVPLVLLLFPDGRLPSPRWRPVVRFAVAVYVIALVGRALAPGPINPDEFGPLDNPLGVEAAAGLAPVVQSVVTVLMLAVMLASAVAVLVRLRRARGIERQQLKWFAYAATLLAVAVSVAVVLPSLGGNMVDTVTIVAALAALPVAIGIAVLRYRLYEIDRLINRTLVYGLLTALLGAVYAAGVFVLGDLLDPAAGDSELAVAASTLAVAALFQPLRRRVQALVDRRFNRARYDAARTVERFSTRLRDQVDLDTLSAELVAVVDHTMQPERVSLWLRPR
jgi:hypothetical protein